MRSWKSGLVLLALLFTGLRLAGAPGGVLMTKDATSAASNEVYTIAPKFPVDWVKDRYAEGYVIDGLWYLGKSWVVVMKQGLGWTQSNRSNLASFVVEQWLADGYYLTDYAEDDQMTITVFSKIPSGPFEQQRHYKAEWVDTPDDQNRWVWRLTYAPFRVQTDQPFFALRRPWPGVSRQEVVVRADPTSFMQKCVDEGMRVTKLQRISPYLPDWFIVGTKMPGEYAQEWFPMNADRIAELEARGYRITCFY